MERPEKNQSKLSDGQDQRATFVIKVKYRQNSTWQGSVAWMEEKTQCNFRSELELLSLMNTALGGQQGSGVEWIEDKAESEDGE